MRSLDNYRTAMAAQKYDFNKGLVKARAEGLAEGRVEGRAEGVLETARNFKRLGVVVSPIVTATGLSIEEIEKLLIYTIPTFFCSLQCAVSVLQTAFFVVK